MRVNSARTDSRTVSGRTRGSNAPYRLCPERRNVAIAASARMRKQFSTVKTPLAQTAQLAASSRHTPMSAPAPRFGRRPVMTSTARKNAAVNTGIPSPGRASSIEPTENTAQYTRLSPRASAGPAASRQVRGASGRGSGVFWFT